MVCAANFLQYQVNECLPLLYPTVCQLSKTYFLPSGGKSQNHACVSSDNQFVCPQLDLSKDSKTRSDQRKRFIEAKKRSHYSTGSSTGYSKQKKILSGIHLVDAGERARESVGSSLTMLEDDCQSVRDVIIIISPSASSFLTSPSCLRKRVKKSDYLAS